MNPKFVGPIIGLIVVFVMAYLVVSLAKPCNGSYTFSLKEGKFDCKQTRENPSNPDKEKDASQPTITEVSPETKKKQPAATSKPKVKVEAPKETPAQVPTAHKAMLSCDQTRASFTTRRAINNDQIADKQCMSIVHKIPSDYLTQPDIYMAQNDGSVTFNTGVRFEGKELWCNCHPVR